MTFEVNKYYLLIPRQQAETIIIVNNKQPWLQSKKLINKFHY